MRAGNMLAISIALSVAVDAGAVLPITECDVVVPPRETGVLQADVECRSYCDTDPSIVCNGDDELCPGAGNCLESWITLSRGSRLELNGHALTMAYQSYGVVCGAAGDLGRCRVAGPGSILGGKGTGVFSASMDVEVANLIIDNTDGAVTSGGRAILTDVVLGGREEFVSAVKGIRATHVRVGPAGMYTLGDLIVDGVLLDHRSGMLAAEGAVRGRLVEAVGYNRIAARDIVLRDLTSVPEPDGSDARLVSLAAERSLRLFDSNAGSITSRRRPRLVRSSCTESTVLGSMASWGVCTGD